MNIIRSYRLSDKSSAVLGASEPTELVELIVTAVRGREIAAGAPR